MSVTISPFTEVAFNHFCYHFCSTNCCTVEVHFIIAWNLNNLNYFLPILMLFIYFYFCCTSVTFQSASWGICTASYHSSPAADTNFLGSFTFKSHKLVGLYSCKYSTKARQSDGEVFFKFYFETLKVKKHN